MNRRQLLASVGSAATLGLAGCLSSKPRKVCTGDCHRLVKWGFDSRGGNAFQTGNLTLTFIVGNTVDELHINVRAYDTSGELKFVDEVTITGDSTETWTGVPFVSRVEIDVTAKEECSVCGEQALTAEKADKIGRRRGLACWASDEGELYLHEVNDE